MRLRLLTNRANTYQATHPKSRYGTIYTVGSYRMRLIIKIPRYPLPYIPPSRRQRTDSGHDEMRTSRACHHHRTSVTFLDSSPITDKPMLGFLTRSRVRPIMHHLCIFIFFFLRLFTSFLSFDLLIFSFVWYFVKVDRRLVSPLFDHGKGLIDRSTHGVHALHPSLLPETGRYDSVLCPLSGDNSRLQPGKQDELSELQGLDTGQRTISRS